MDIHSIGNRIRFARKTNRMNRKDFAAAVHIKVSRLENIENDKTQLKEIEISLIEKQLQINLKVNIKKRKVPAQDKYAKAREYLKQIKSKNSTL